MGVSWPTWFSGLVAKVAGAQHMNAIYLCIELRFVQCGLWLCRVGVLTNMAFSVL